MESLKFIYQNRILIYSQSPSVNISATYPSNEHVKLNEEQYQFHLNNPTATMQEVWNMALTIAPQLTNADVEAMRQQAYLTESNPIMFAFRQYFELGEMEKYEAKHAEWVAKVQEIRDRYPYIID